MRAASHRSQSSTFWNRPALNGLASSGMRFDLLRRVDQPHDLPPVARDGEKLPVADVRHGTHALPLGIVDTDLRADVPPRVEAQHRDVPTHLAHVAKLLGGHP